QLVGGCALTAGRDRTVNPGGDERVEIWISGGAAKVSAVRLWVGVQDAEGSVKAKADLEKDHWHTHVEVPRPLADGSKLWVEVETETGEKHAAGFDLKI